MVYVFSQIDQTSIKKINNLKEYLRYQTDFVIEIRTGISKDKLKSEINTLFNKYKELSNDPLYIYIMLDRTFYHIYSSIANTSHIENWKKYQDVTTKVKSNKILQSLDDIDTFNFKDDAIYNINIK